MNIKKNDKGIIMIALVIVVIMLFILSAVTVYEANEVIATARLESTMTNLLLIQAKVRIINEKVLFEKASDDDEKKQGIYVGTKLSESPSMIEELKQKQTERNKAIIDDIDNEEILAKYYVLSQSDLSDFGLNTLNAAEGFIVNYEDEEDIIYVRGVQDQKGNILHTLKELPSIGRE